MTKQWHGGKGSVQRPTNKDKYNDNYDRIFNTSKEDKVKTAIEEVHKKFPETLKSLGEITALGAVFFMTILALTPSVDADDNLIHIEQSGDTFQLGVDQFGFNNTIDMLNSDSFITATSLDMYLVQVNSSSLENKIIFDEITGTGNQMKLGQGIAWDDLSSDTNLDWYYDGYEAGGHEINITMYGDYNQLAVQQTNQTEATDGHDFDLHLAGDYNEVQIKQQSNGVKDIDLTIYNDYNDVFIRQKGANSAHTATITLDGLYATDLTLKQFGNSNGTNQTYSLTQNCYTVGGCTVSVTQGQ